MGAGASANFYEQMIHYCQNRYGAVQDTDYPRMIIDNYPLEGFDETGIVDEKLVKQQIQEALQNLEQAGCDILVIVCNTVHVFWEELQAAVNVPLVNVVTSVLDQVQSHGYKKVGLLCSETTNEVQLYQKNSPKSLEIIAPDKEQQDQLNQVIEHVMGGVQNDYDAKLCKNVIHDMKRAGAEAVILGCTEIPLAIHQLHTDMRIFDSISIAVGQVVDFARSS